MSGRNGMIALGRRSVLVGIVALLCAGAGCRDATDKPQPVRVLAAASTRDAVEEVATLYHQETGAEVQVIAESSSKLATQIASDAPADLFLSANDQWADFVADKGYAQESRPLLTNRLVLVVPRGNPAGVANPEDLAGARVKHVALAGPAVPAGTYGREALTKLGLLEPLKKDKKVVDGDDVRVTLAFVERGEAEAGIVYDTDARITDKVEVVHTFDPATHRAIRYPLVLLKQGQEKEAARKFYEFMQSPRALEVFRKHGFTTLPEK